MEDNEKKLPELDAGAEGAEQSIAEKTSTEDSERRASEFTPLDELLYDIEDSELDDSSYESEVYESFLDDYRLVVSRALRGETADPVSVQSEGLIDNADAIEDEKSGEESGSYDFGGADSALSQDNTDEGGEDISYSADGEKTHDTEGESYEYSYESYDGGDEDDIIEFGEQISLLDSIDAELIPFSDAEDESEGNDRDLQLSIDDDIFKQRPIVEETEKYNPDRPRKIDTVFEIIEMLVFTLLAVMIVTSFFFRHSIVDGSSMQNTLQDGDHLIICDLFYTPDYGDIIVFEDTESPERKALVKRIIGLAGDTVEIKSDGSVLVNGTELSEEYVYIDTSSGTYTDAEQIFTVGEGEVFVLGDHRNVSADSRRFGTIDEDTILGRAILRFYPFSEFGAIE